MAGSGRSTRMRESGRTKKRGLIFFFRRHYQGLATVPSKNKSVPFFVPENPSRLEPISSNDYAVQHKGVAPRPRYSVLDCSETH